MLVENQIVKMPSGDLAKVLFVNESRARIKYLSEKKNHFTTATGKDVEFNSGGKEFDISPNSEVVVMQNVECRM